MFKKVFTSISKALGSKEAPPAPEPKAPAPKAAPPEKSAPPAKAAPAAKAPAKAPEKPTPAPAPAPKPTPPAPQKSPEELCAITPEMSHEEIKTRLAFLYRRYNRATSSLDPKLRAEADLMLDAIVVIREKVFGPM